MTLQRDIQGVTFDLRHPELSGGEWALDITTDQSATRLMAAAGLLLPNDRRVPNPPMLVRLAAGDRITVDSAKPSVGRRHVELMLRVTFADTTAPISQRPVTIAARDFAPRREIFSRAENASDPDVAYARFLSNLARAAGFPARELRLLEDAWAYAGQQSGIRHADGKAWTPEAQKAKDGRAAGGRKRITTGDAHRREAKRIIWRAQEHGSDALALLNLSNVTAEVLSAYEARAESEPRNRLAGKLASLQPRTIRNALGDLFHAAPDENGHRRPKRLECDPDALA